ncbi:hypothetical protein B0H14DRAFT_2605875 [Mycena olivaceomarginata]|nr:hypothetical protein B0H14DRAFT_2605875 [Mycena olivaceomarginata]
MLSELERDRARVAENHSPDSRGFNLKPGLRQLTHASINPRFLTTIRCLATNLTHPRRSTTARFPFMPGARPRPGYYVFSRGFDSLLFAFIPLVWAIWIFVVVLLVQNLIRDSSRAIHEELLSKITADTPISGFYGPGAWWGWLITTRELPSGWDFDLIGASAYIVATAGDLILRSRSIAQLGDAASESVLLPAVICMERVVLVGTGSSLLSLAVGLIFRPSGLAGLRSAGVATVPLVFAAVASGFTLSAHQVIAQTAPVFWCRDHFNNTGKIGLTPIHVPAILGTFWSWAIVSHAFWTGMGMAIAVIAVVFLRSVMEQRMFETKSATMTGLFTLAVVPLIICFPWLMFTVMGTMMWLIHWVFFWWPLYILAFFPHLGYFPVSGIIDPSEELG